MRTIVGQVGKNSMDITVWSCFGNYNNAKCPRNCTEDIFKECESAAEAGEAVAIVEEQDGEE